MRACATIISVIKQVALALSITAALATTSFAATSSGTIISNTAQLQFSREGVSTIESVSSNTTTATVVPLPSTSALTVLRFTDASSATQTATAGPTQCLSNGSFSTLAQPVFANGSTVDASSLLALTTTDIVHAGDAVFLQVTDADQNRDAVVIDTLDLTITSAIGDTETLRMRETGVNTGVFVGYIQTRSSATASSGDCVLQVDRDSQITARYTDAYQNTDTSNVSVLVDPYGLIFDSITGQPVNGARVRLINALTGAPAAVFGDNGTATYPSEMTTGNAVTDSSGTVYNLPAGVFRFPLVALGQYRIEVTPPTGYTWSSIRSIADINQLSSAPYRLSTASYGAAFSVTTPAAVAIDLPLDPSGTQLYVTKSTTTSIAAVGDFVQYTLGVQNVSTTTQVTNVTLTDVLPQGVKYQAGSARVAGQAIADPAISSDGRTLNFALGTLAAAANLKLSYVVAVTVAAREEKLTNSAYAANVAGAASNLAQVSIRLRNELFTDTAFITGRIVQGSCNQELTGLPGVAGVRVYLEDGRYAVTDDEGKYHFDGVTAGSHVVQMDTVTLPDTLEPQLCDERVRNAGRGYSQFVDLRAGSLWRADFVVKQKAPPAGQVHYGMNTRIAGDAELAHALNVQVDALAVSNAKAMVMLPAGLDYVPGSATLNGQTLADPQNMEGTLIFRLNELAVGMQSGIAFKTRLSAEASGGFIIKSVLLFDTPAQKDQRSAAVENRASRGDMNYESASYRFSPHFAVLGTELSAQDKQQLDKLVNEWRGVKNLRIRSVGHTDKNVIPPSKQHLFADNYVLSQARAASVAEYLRAALGLSTTQIETEGKGPDEPIAQGNDADSLARNRRVEISIDGIRIKQLGKVSVITAHADAPMLATTGVVISQRSVTSGKPATQNALADIDVETLSGGIAMVRPVADDVPAIPSIKIAITHAPSQSVELRLNAAPVSALNFDGVSAKRDNSLALSRWRGVDLKDGDNTLLAIVRNADGSEAQRIERVVHYSGGAVRAELVKEQSALLADGSKRPVIALRMFDAAGNPARPGTIGTYSVDAPYRSWWEVQQLQDKQLASLAPRDPQFVVDDDGLARIELAPSADSGMAVIKLRFNERQAQELRVWLEPQTRDWVLVGLAEGTAAYNTISGNAEAATADDVAEGYEQDGRIAFFAKGRIKGDFLLTLAYDSARAANQDKQSLLGSIDPNKYYTLYGDASEQRFEAASQRKLYIKLERRQFMAMFGDFNTGITMTELGRYSRTLNGVKSEYAGDQFGYTAFAANTDQGYVQDELQGDGTSGLYQLTQQNIIANSDKLRIEVRDRFDTGTVLSSTTLTRYIDYDIDYLNGTVYFKQPVMSRDSSFNPQFIIADYEVDSGMNEAISAGGRVYGKFDSRFGKGEVGASFINEGAQVGDTRMAAVDTRIQLGEATQLRAELARSESDNPARAAQADAYFTELRHVSKRVEASAYFRMQDSGFGFGQQLSTETGSRKAGVDARVKLDDQWSVRSEAQVQQVMSTAAERELITVQAQRDTQLTTAGAGVRHVADSNTTAGDVSAEQGFVTGSVKLLDQRLTLRAEQDVSLNSTSGVTDYPDRSLLGVDYLLTREVTLFGDYEHANGADFDADMTRIGLRANPWSRAQLSSSMNQQFTENGTRTFANLGLTQGWQINDRWAMDFGVDQSRTVRGANSYTLNSNTTLASGTQVTTQGSGLGSGSVPKWQTADFLSLSVSSLYRTELWSITDRLEHRHASAEDRWAFTGGFYREAVKGHAFALVTQYLDTRNQSSGDALTANLQLSWAYRPIDSRFIVLDRIDLKHQRTASLTQTVQSSRVVNNTHINWQQNVRTQMGLQLGARYVISSFDGDEYRGSTGLLGADYRRDLNRTFDVGVHGTLLQSFNSGVGRASLGADVGVTFMKNAWVSLGYNVRGYHDQDFDDAHYLAQGPYLKFRIKFDQDTFKDLDMSGLRAQAN